MQRESDLDEKLAATDNEIDLASLEAEFVKIAASYAASKGISAATWKRAEVPADVLKKAGSSSDCDDRIEADRDDDGIKGGSAAG
jgi:hypothetical protein